MFYHPQDFAQYFEQKNINYSELLRILKNVVAVNNVRRHHYFVAQWLPFRSESARKTIDLPADHRCFLTFTLSADVCAGAGSLLRVDTG
jgi:hypothetical protein